MAIAEGKVDRHVTNGQGRCLQNTLYRSKDPLIIQFAVLFSGTLPWRTTLEYVPTSTKGKVKREVGIGEKREVGGNRREEGIRGGKRGKEGGRGERGGKRGEEGGRGDKRG